MSMRTYEKERKKERKHLQNLSANRTPHRKNEGVENYNDVDNLQRRENVNRHRSIKMQLTKKYQSFGKENKILYHLHKCRYGSFYFLMIIT